MEFITVDHFYTAFTDRNGHFSFEIPINHIKNENVIRLSHKKTYQSSLENDQPISFYLGTSNHILSDKALTLNPILISKALTVFIGQVSLKSVDLSDKSPVPVPIILYNGVEISYQEFSKMKREKSNRYNLEDKNYYYFEHEAAQILFGIRAEHGIYLFFD